MSIRNIITLILLLLAGAACAQPSTRLRLTQLQDAPDTLAAYLIVAGQGDTILYKSDIVSIDSAGRVFTVVVGTDTIRWEDTTGSGGGDSTWLKPELEAGDNVSIQLNDTVFLTFRYPDSDPPTSGRTSAPAIRFDFPQAADERPYRFIEARDRTGARGDFFMGFYDNFYYFQGDSSKMVLAAQESTMTLDNAAGVGFFRFKNVSNPAKIRLEGNFFSRYVDVAAPDSISANYTITLPRTQGASGETLVNDGAGNLTWGEGSGGGAGGLDTASLTFRYTTAQSNTSLAIPAGAKSVEIHAIGAGGGGGGGRRGATSTIRLGGGGGGGGGYSWGTFSIADDLAGASTLYLTVGAAGTAGARATTNDTHGGAGGDGGATFVGTTSGPATVFIRAYGGTGGQGSSNGLAGASTAGSLILGGQGGTSSAGVLSSAFSATTSGGGAGGIINADNTFVDGGNAGQAAMGIYSLLLGGSDPSYSGQTPTLLQGPKFGQGGSGGGARDVGNAPGGDGVRGGGGGGGGPSLNGNNSGVGGSGGPGYLLITFYF